ncbi:hypothetical protein Q5741_09890 [Paenibacillus sp. JX-17]|uniref:Uncharacterized protein n=1 Tax=Paenibacillus lacisoli TaxID=3064525 RepID=A0ABT9CGJ7_9BACL|nr:hypothetical protein [Paenibacillus sp. JX-17]MDO7906733.1 hypothetical protein [Paenibacillus sp. JX-17]
MSDCKQWAALSGMYGFAASVLYAVLLIAPYLNIVVWATGALLVFACVLHIVYGLRSSVEDNGLGEMSGDIQNHK